jgi:hypothetical protein
MSANTPLTPPLPFNRNPVRAIEQAISALREILQRHPEVRRDFDCPAFIAHELEPALEAAAELERARGAVLAPLFASLRNFLRNGCSARPEDRYHALQELAELERLAASPPEQPEKP